MARKHITKRTHSSAPSDPLLGSLLSNRYEIIALLGEGDFGRVYKARQTQINRTVAIKTLKTSLLRESFQSDLFAKESEPIVALSHPNIVAVYECGMTDGSEPYFAMDLLNGETLRELIDAEAPLPAARAAIIASQIADALASAHEAGVLHGDLKPVNAIVSESEVGTDVVKLVDFDIVKFVRRPEEDLDSPNPRSNVMESAHYMSPERCDGAPLDGRSDIYSLGCMLHEMLLGRPPFGGDTVESTIKAHTQQQPLPFFPLLSEDSAIACDLEHITLKCLEKEPEKRYQTAAELVADLNRAGKGEGVGADRKTALNARKPLSQAMWMQVILSVMLLSTLAGIVVLVTAVSR